MQGARDRGCGPSGNGARQARARGHLPSPDGLRGQGVAVVSGTLLIARRELRAYLRSPFGYIVAAAMLLIDGLLFQGYALGAGARLSADVLHDFFYFASGTTMVAAILLSMRLLAEERQTGTLVLLNTAPVGDVD